MDSKGENSAAPLRSPEIARAVALRYAGPNQMAPVVVAKGAGANAEEIIRIAKKHGIPIQDNPVLVGLLAGIKVEREIPPALYDLVARVISAFYRVENGLLQKKKEEKSNP